MTMITQIDNLASYMQWVQEQQTLLQSLNYDKTRACDKEYELCFRGVSDSDYEDIPSVYRDGLILELLQHH